jgi:hypothetical protein
LSALFELIERLQDYFLHFDYLNTLFDLHRFENANLDFVVVEIANLWMKLMLLMIQYLVFVLIVDYYLLAISLFVVDLNNLLLFVDF